MNWGMMRVRFVWLVLCREFGIMYNLTSFIAIVQQAIKKPLVTELLRSTSYAWGWRCERYYVQFLDIGQVTYTKRSIALNPQDGDWRWLPGKPQLKLNCIRWFFGVGGCLFAVSLSGNPVGYSRAWQPVVTGMKNARYWQYLAFVKFAFLLHISLNFRRWRAFSAKPLYWGGGFCIPPQFLSGERIAQTKRDVKDFYQAYRGCGDATRRKQDDAITRESLGNRPVGMTEENPFRL